MENPDVITEMDSVIWNMISNKKKELIYRNNDRYSMEQLSERYMQVKKYRKQLKKLQSVPKIEQRTEEWYNARSGIITASNFCDAMNSNRSFIVKKATNDTSNRGSIACDWGTKYEPVACDIYRHLHSNINVYDFGLILDNKIDCIGASPDGITDLGVMVEIKCPYSRDITDKKISNQYWCQIQGQLAVCKLKECDFSQFKFKQFNDKDEFMEQSKLYKYFGIVIVKNDGSYIYSSLGTCSDDMISVLASVMNVEGEYQYWVLETHNIQRVCFDKDLWDTNMLPLLLNCWEKIKQESNRYLPSGFLKDDSD